MNNPSISLANNPQLYSKPRTFPAKVTAVSFTDEQGVPLTDVPLGDGALIRFSVTFEQSEVKISGVRVPVTQTAETMVKLFRDSA